MRKKKIAKVPRLSAREDLEDQEISVGKKGSLRERCCDQEDGMGSDGEGESNFRHLLNLKNGFSPVAFP